MTSSLDLIRGRQVVATLTNQSGGAVIAGDVVIVSTANDESFTTTTSAAYNSTQVGIALDSIVAAASGRVLLQGYAPLVNVSASATRGYYLFTHTVAKQATSSATFGTGAFGQVLKSGTTPSAYIFPPALAATAGVARSGATTDNHLAIWNGSNADSIKDGGAVPTSANGLIGLTVYNPGGTDTTISGTSMADVDATNLIVTFTAPASGNVLVRLNCTSYLSASTAVLYWGLREATTDIAGPAVAHAGNASDGGWIPHSVPLYLTSISAGSHSYKWSAKRATANCVMRYGSGYAPAVMEVWAAP